jgi:hypothetical protein
MRTSVMSMTVLSTRVLNRTYLRRQLLAERAPRPAAEIVEHLVAVQGQESDSPYLGLWARSSEFRIEDLTGLLHDRTVVRSGLLRGTQHLSSGADYRWLRPTLQPALERMAGRAGRLGGCDPDAFEEAGREIIAEGGLTRPEIARRLAARFPEADLGELAFVVHLKFALLHPPPAGTWGHRGRVGCVLAEDWLGGPLAGADAEALVLRYLAAFGPASVKDVQVWSGLTRLAALMKELRPRLRVFRDEAGIELYDLPGAPIEDADRPAPVVFLPEFDNAVLGHADRSRILHPGDRQLVMPGWSIVRPTVLVDGFVAATWERKGPRIEIAPFRPLAPTDRSAVEAEAARLIDFVAPDSEPEIVWA